MVSSIVDVPRKYGQADLFGIQKYQDALVKFIKCTATPITVALQGEWGSGKTSLMNQLKNDLCDADGAPYFPVWINTWQYSLMKTSSQAIFSILEGCINQIGEVNKQDSQWEDSKKKIGGLFKKFANVGAKIVANQVGVDGDTVDDLFSGEAKSDIMQLKEEISKLIDSALQTDRSKIGFTFYIDDLDRIDPPQAVEILELLKNIFDLDKCVFILAIDYDVVIKGLKPKFGELTDKNEREFRSFFDKIIQLPFSMPVGSYSVNDFLMDALSKIEFFTPTELKDADFVENLSEVVRLSVGTNPRSLKRLSNTLSLISIINDATNSDSDRMTKLINFSLVCIQIAYPYIYNQLVEAPDFKAWDEEVAAKLKLRKLSDEEKETLSLTSEFDDEWEKIVFRMCQKETHLSNRVFSVSLLLNRIAGFVPEKADLGEIIGSTIKLSAVTNLKSAESPVTKITGKTAEARNSLCDQLAVKYSAFWGENVMRTGSDRNGFRIKQFHNTNDVYRLAFLIVNKMMKMELVTKTKSAGDKVRAWKPEGPYDRTNWMKEDWTRIMLSHPMDTTNPASIDGAMKWCMDLTEEIKKMLL